MASLTPIFLNNVYSTVQAGSSAIGSSTATGINVASGDGANFGTIGTNQFVPAVIVDTSTSPETVKEYVWITSRSTDALTVVRQAEESSRYPASTSTIQAGYVIAAVASRAALLIGSALRPTQTRPADCGYLTWNYDPILATLANNSKGCVVLSLVPIPTDMTVNNISVWIGTAGTSMTSAQNFAGLYDSSGNLLGQTADQSTAWASGGLVTMALTAPVTINGGPDVYVYAAYVMNSSGSGPLFNGNANAVALNANRSVSTARGSISPTGQTSLPSTLTLASQTLSGSLNFWAALS